MPELTVQQALHILCLPANHNIHDLKNAWRKAAKTHHPDRQTTNNTTSHRDAYEQAQQAYQTLKQHHNTQNNTKQHHSTQNNPRPPDNNPPRQAALILIEWAMNKTIKTLYPTITTRHAQHNITNAQQTAWSYATSITTHSGETPLTHAKRALANAATDPNNNPQTEEILQQAHHILNQLET